MLWKTHKKWWKTTLLKCLAEYLQYKITSKSLQTPLIAISAESLPRCPVFLRRLITKKTKRWRFRMIWFGNKEERMLEKEEWQVWMRFSTVSWQRPHHDDENLGGLEPSHYWFYQTCTRRLFITNLHKDTAKDIEANCCNFFYSFLLHVL